MRQAFVRFDQPIFSSFSALAKELEKDMANNYTYADENLFHETPEAFLGCIDLPGVNFADINIELEENRLTISAERKNPFDKEKTSKKYQQTFSLPKNIDAEKINAHYENGVLSLSIPKMEEVKTKKKIQVTTGEKPRAWTQFLGFGKTEETNVVN
jgi:HSP20 family protein